MSETAWTKLENEIRERDAADSRARAKVFARIRLRDAMQVIRDLRDTPLMSHVAGHLDEVKRLAEFELIDAAAEFVREFGQES